MADTMDSFEFDDWSEAAESDPDCPVSPKNYQTTQKPTYPIYVKKDSVLASLERMRKKEQRSQPKT